MNSALKITQGIEQHYAQATILFASHQEEEANKLKKIAHAAEIDIIKYNLHASKLEEAARRRGQEASQHDFMLADYLQKADQARSLGKSYFATLWEKAAEQTQAVMRYTSQGLEALGKGEEFIRFSDAALISTAARELVVEAIAHLTRASTSSDPSVKIYGKRTLDKIKVATDLYFEAAEAHVAQNPEEAEQLKKEARTTSARAMEYAKGRAVPPKKSTQNAKTTAKLLTAAIAATAHLEEGSSGSQLSTDATVNLTPGSLMDSSTATQQEKTLEVKKKITFTNDEEK